MAIHSSIFTWRIPRTKEPGGLQNMGLRRVRHDLNDLAHILLERRGEDKEIQGQKQGGKKRESGGGGRGIQTDRQADNKSE